MFIEIDKPHEFSCYENIELATYFTLSRRTVRKYPPIPFLLLFILNPTHNGVLFKFFKQLSFSAEMFCLLKALYVFHLPLLYLEPILKVYRYVQGFAQVFYLYFTLWILSW